MTTSHRAWVNLPGDKLPVLLGAPPGTRVLDVHRDAAADTVGLVLEHGDWTAPEGWTVVPLDLVGVAMDLSIGEMSDEEIGAVVRQQTEQTGATTCALLALRPQKL